jgi:hypothetical protein
MDSFAGFTSEIKSWPNGTKDPLRKGLAAKVSGLLRNAR